MFSNNGLRCHVIAFCLAVVIVGADNSVDEEKVALLFSIGKNASSSGCNVVGVQLRDTLVSMVDVSETVYPKAFRDRDGFPDLDFCLYEAVTRIGQNFDETPLVALFTQDGKAYGVIALSERKQFRIDLQPFKAWLSVQPFVDESVKGTFLRARNPLNTFGRERLIEQYLVVDAAAVENDGELLIPRLLLTLATSNQMVSTVGLRFRLVRLLSWSELDAVPLTEDISLTLGTMSAFRQVNATDVSHDTLHLFTGKPQSSRGKAYVHGMCRFAIATSVTSIAERENPISRATAFVHETAHLLGIGHDRPSWRENAADYPHTCTCEEDSTCIMTPSIPNPGPIRLSNCTLNDLMHTVHAYDSEFDCLLKEANPLKPEPKAASCGNAVVEPGEQCDTGIPAFSNEKSACNLSTCTLGRLQARQLLEDRELCPWVADIKGDSLPDECCFKHDGMSLKRPDDFPCDSHKGRCRDGRCLSRDAQCRRLFGSDFRSGNDFIYVVNGGKPWSSGFCKYRPEEIAFERTSFTVERCAPEDALCGALLCSTGDANAPLGNFDEVFRHELRMGSRKLRHFLSAIKSRDLSGVRDTALVADGTFCSPDNTKVCRDGRCLPATNP